MVRTGAKNEADTETASVFAFDTVKLGEQWQLTGGLRYDYYRRGTRSARRRPAITTKFDRTDKMLSWRAALAYKPVESGTIYFGVGTSFNPSAEGLTSNFNGDNASLKPEKSLTYEVGTKWEFLEKRLTLNLAAFPHRENERAHAGRRSG